LPEVEEHERLDEHLLSRGKPPYRRGRPAVEGHQRLLLERGAAAGRQAWRPVRARPRLVHQLVADHVALAREAPHHRLQPLHEALLEADAARPRTVGPEALERPLHGRVLDVVRREGRLGRVRETVVDAHPRRKAVAAVLGPEAVLVEVEQHEDTPARKLANGPRQRIDVG
jgi:hypothetical protein